MRRKLINYEAFERIQRDSLSSAERELSESQDILAAALGVDGLYLDCFGESSVVYGTLDGTYVRADYALKNEHLVVENIEELVIDNDSADRKGRSTVSDMIDALLNDEAAKAGELFESYMGLPSVRRNLLESRQVGAVRPRAEAKAAGKAKTRNSKEKSGVFAARKRKLDSTANPNTRTRSERGSLNFGDAKDPSYQKKYQKARKAKHVPRKVLDAKGNVKVKRTMKEWVVLSENVANYVSYRETGTVLRESQVKHDERGNVVAIRLPLSRLRNEAKILSLNYNTLKSDCKNLRETALGLAADKDFCKGITAIKRHNAMSDNNALQEALESLIGRYPHVLYLTQGELASEVSEALSLTGATNYDDQTCAFLAEGILRTAHNVFSDRVEKILRLSQAEVTSESEDPYLDFQNIVANFYPSLDENFALEMRVFTDLLEAVNQVHTIGERAGDGELAEAAAEYLEELSSICNGESGADLDFAEEVAEWLRALVETNLNMGTWNVSNTPHTTLNGDVPEMAEMARKSYSPASDNDPGWGDAAPQISQDSMSYRDGAAQRARTNSWGNISGADIWPNLSNPYIPKSYGDYTMTAEKGVDKNWEDGFGQLGSPVFNKEPKKPGYEIKMKNGSETDLVQDR